MNTDQRAIWKSEKGEVDWVGAEDGDCDPPWNSNRNMKSNPFYLSPNREK